MAKEGEKYFVVKSCGLYLLDETPADFRLDDFPSCRWIGDDIKEGLKIEDFYNKRLVEQGKATADRVAAMRGCRVRDKL